MPDPIPSPNTAKSHQTFGDSDPVPEGTTPVLWVAFTDEARLAPWTAADSEARVKSTVCGHGRADFFATEYPDWTIVPLFQSAPASPPVPGESSEARVPGEPACGWCADRGAVMGTTGRQPCPECSTVPSDTEGQG